MKQIISLISFLSLCIALCFCAQAATLGVEIEPYGIGLGTVYKQYPAPSTQIATITNNSSEVLYLQQPECNIATIGPLSKTQLNTGESAVFTISAQTSLSVGNHSGEVKIYDTSGNNLGAVQIQYVVADKPEVLIKTVQGEGYNINLTSVWQGMGDYHFVQSGFDIEVAVIIYAHHKIGEDFVIKVNDETVVPQLRDSDKALIISFPNISEGEYTITVEGVESRPLLKPENETKQENNILGGKLDNPDDELFGKLLKYAEEYEIDEGAKYVVWLEVDDASETTHDIEKRLIHSVVNEENITHYLDINLLKQIGNGTPNFITDVDGNISITLEIPKGHREAPELMYRNFGVVRLHNGVAEKLYGNYSPETGLLTFKTDRFSTYALFYEDIPVPAGDAELPRTGDNSLLFFWLIISFLSGILLVRCKKNTN